jgi:hypothetical protein
MSSKFDGIDEIDVNWERFEVFGGVLVVVVGFVGVFDFVVVGVEVDVDFVVVVGIVEIANRDI